MRDEFAAPRQGRRPALAIGLFTVLLVAALSVAGTGPAYARAAVLSGHTSAAPMTAAGMTSSATGSGTATAAPTATPTPTSTSTSTPAASTPASSNGDSGGDGGSASKWWWALLLLLLLIPLGRVMSRGSPRD